MELRESGGEGGIRTLGTGVSPYNGLANRRIRPLCHLSDFFINRLPKCYSLVSLNRNRLVSMGIHELLRANQRRRFRTQSGTVVERHDGHYLRFYVDGQDGERQKVTEFLCKLQTPKLKIEISQRRRMAEINGSQRAEAPLPVELTIGDFWIATYFPWVEKNKRASTARGYAKLWSGYVEKPLAALPLKKYLTTDATAFLNTLAPKLGRNTLHHIKSLLSGIFAHAAALGLVKDNPIRNAKWLVNPGRKTPREQVAYTIEETVAVLKALERADARLVWVLSSVMGLRPSEIAGLKWTDIDDEWIHVRRAAPYGLAPVKDEETKTEGSARDLRIVEPCRSMLAAWSKASGKPTTGWLFSRPGDRPIDHSAFVARQIAPAARLAIGERWKGLYAGRRGHGTAVTRLESLTAARQTLGHDNEKTTAEHYALPDIVAGTAGLEKYAQAVVEGMKNL